MVTIYFQRPTEGEPDVTIMDVPRDGKTLADMVRELIGPGSTVMTDEHTAYKSLGGGGTTTMRQTTVRASTPPAGITKFTPITASAG